MKLTVLPPLDRLPEPDGAPDLAPEAPLPAGALSKKEIKRCDELYHWFAASESGRTWTEVHCGLLRGEVPRADGSISRNPSQGRRDAIAFYKHANSNGFTQGIASGLVAAHALNCDTREMRDVLLAGRRRGYAPEGLLRRAGAILRTMEVPKLAACLYEESLAYDDQDVEAYGSLGQLAMTASQYDKALAWFEKAAMLQQDMPQALFAKAGNACTMMHKHERALFWFHCGVDKDPEDLLCLAGAAGALSQLGRLQECDAMVNRALELMARGCAVAYHPLAALTLAAGETQNRAALLQLKDIVRVACPEDLNLHELLARALERVNEDSHALAFYATALARNPTDVRLYLCVAQVRTKLGQEALAIKILDRALALPRQSPPSVFAKTLDAFAAFLLGRQQDAVSKQRAVTIIKRILQGDPRNAERHAELGTLLRDLGNPIDAGDAFWMAEKCGCGEAGLWREIAFCYWGQSSRLTRCEKALRKVIEAFPDDLQCKQMLADISKGDRQEVKALLTEVYDAIDAPALATAGLSRCIERPTFADTFRKALPKSRVAFIHEGKTVEGSVLGLNYMGRMVARDGAGQRYWLGYNNTVLESAPASHAVDTVPRGLHYRLNEERQRRLDERLQDKAIGHLSLQDVLCRLNQNKFDEGLITGGFLARLLAGEDLQGNVDVDIVTTLLPKPVRYAITGLYTKDAPEAAPVGTDLEGSLFSSKHHSMFHGVVTLGSMPGLDIATVRVDGMYEGRTPMPGSDKPVFPVSFGTDLIADAKARDFTCNALYYDPVQKEILDPTGSGIVDALAKRLRIPDEANVMKNDSYALRFCRMVQRGWQADAHTRALMRDNANKFFRLQDTSRLVYNLTKAVSHAVVDADDITMATKAWFSNLVDTMHASGFGDLGARYIAPLQRQVTEALTEALLTEALKDMQQ